MSNYFTKVKDQENYRSWKLNLSDFKKNWSINEKIIFFLKLGTLAPSTHNTQPWLFEFVDDNSVNIMPDWQKKLPATDPNNRNLYISLGCVLTNIIASAGYFGFKVDEKIANTKEEYFIRLTFEESKKSDKKLSLAELASEITKRFSDKSSYEMDEVPPKFLKNASQQISTLGFSLKFVTTVKKRKRIADLYLQAGFGFAKNPSFRKELGNWLKRNDTVDGEGMPGFVASLSLVQSIIGKKLMKLLPPLPKVQVRKDAKHLERGPIIGMISSDKNTPCEHILTGKKYQELSLMSVKNGLSITPMTALIENPEYHPELREIFQESKQNQQMFFRLGYSKAERYHTPRRPIEDSLL